MIADIRQLFDDYNVSYQSEGHKHCRPGWVNMACPFCTGNIGLHLGLTINGKIAYCWRCGWHPVSFTVAKLLKVREEEAKKILLQYIGARGLSETGIKKTNTLSFKLPSNTSSLQAHHKMYLKKRNFDAKMIEKVWNVQGTGPISLLDKINYAHRILVPIYWEGQIVSFQARDISNRHPLKYIACPQNREIVPHNETLYGKPDKWKEIGLCCEGVFDVWRLGERSFCTYGIKYTHRQVRLMTMYFERIYILFDNDPQAQIQAQKLKADLNFRNVRAEIIKLPDDPASLSQKKADELTSYLLRKHN